VYQLCRARRRTKDRFQSWRQQVDPIGADKLMAMCMCETCDCPALPDDVQINNSARQLNPAVYVYKNEFLKTYRL